MAYTVQAGSVMFTVECPSDLRRRGRSHSLARYMAICRGWAISSANFDWSCSHPTNWPVPSLPVIR